jgi:uncharacterized NAD(P)/FAD-binding protein YdhS
MMTADKAEMQAAVAIVGGGASGVCVAHALARRYGIRAAIVEPSGQLGRGLAYGTPCMRHLLNVKSAGMSAVADDPDHFVKWLRNNGDPQARPEGFAPRHVYGRYLSSLAAEAEPVHLRAAAIAWDHDGNAARLELSDGRRVAARQVVLALGNFDPAPVVRVPDDAARLYHHNAWDDAFYADVRPEDPVILIGTGLTAVDVVLRLRDNGHRGVLTAISRHGWWPARHGDGAKPSAAPDIEPGTSPRAALRAFHKAVLAGASPCALVSALRSRTNAIWLSWDEVQRRQFRRHLQRRWDIMRHRMAPDVADAIEADQASGRLVTQPGHVVGLEADDDMAVVTARTVDGEAKFRAARVVNCTGPSLNYAQAGSRLLQAMLNQGAIAPGPLGGGLNATPEGWLIARDGTVATRLATLGPARLGVLFESIAMPEIHVQAAALADRIAEKLRITGT